MRHFLPASAAMLATALALAVGACGGSDGMSIATDPTDPVTCGDGTHRCCAPGGFECVPLATGCTLADSACRSSPPSDGGAEAQSSCPDGLTRCCIASGTYACVASSSCVDESVCMPGGTDACPNTTIPACWLGQPSIACKSDLDCARTGGSCSPTGVCDCPDCEANALCGSATCVSGTQCVRAIGGQHATCRCVPTDSHACAPPP
jgi:hypothetical protein